MRRGLVLAALVAAIVVAACGEAPEPDASGPIVLERRDSGFVLSMRIGSDTVDAGAAIDISSVLTWEGPNPKATIWGSGSGPVSFGLKQLDGDIELGGVFTADCAMHDFARLVPVAFPFRKSGGISADDPNADFYRTFFADPMLRLPAGRWRVTASAGGYLAECAMDAPTFEITLEAEILVR